MKDLSKSKKKNLKAIGYCIIDLKGKLNQFSTSSLSSQWHSGRDAIYLHTLMIQSILESAKFPFNMYVQ